MDNLPEPHGSDLTNCNSGPSWQLSRTERRALGWALVMLAVAGLALASFLILGRPLVDIVYEGRAPSWINSFISNPDGGPVDWYYSRANFFFSWLLTVWLWLLLGMLAIAFRQRIMSCLRGFFREPDHALNLSIFRIVLFGNLLPGVWLDNSDVLHFSRMPRELIVPPYGIGFLLPYIPISESVVTPLLTVLRFSCLTGTIGLFTRLSAAITCICVLYTMGITQCFGKVNHGHFVPCFLAILAVSRAGDVLSVDGLIASWRRGFHGETAPPFPSRVYGLPLRFIWLLIGLIYFFPGFWKLFGAGYVGEWANRDNLRFMMYAAWESQGWMPLFRIDGFPLVCQFLAIATIVFELGFVFMVISPRTRPAIALVGWAFHYGTRLFMNIDFVLLRLMYVAFFNWHAILHWVGQRLLREVRVTYDDRSRLVCRSLAMARSLDIFGGIHFFEASKSAAVLPAGFAFPESFSSGIVVQNARDTLTGLAAWRALTARTPFLWPIALLLATMSSRIADHLFRRRTSVDECTDAAPPERPSTLTVTIVGSLFLILNSYFGFLQIVDGWPFACYPTFAGIQAPMRKDLEFVAVVGGEKLVVDQAPIRNVMKASRWPSMKHQLRLIEDKDEQIQRLTILWRKFDELHLVPPNAERVEVNVIQVSTVPEDNREILERTLLAVIDPAT